MLVINGQKFYEEPGSCGTCPFLLTGNSRLSHSDRGFCLQWEERHHTWTTPPRRCKRLFRQAFSADYPDGMELAIVTKR